MHQQHADTPTLEELAAIGKLVLVVFVVHVHQTVFLDFLWFASACFATPRLARANRGRSQ
jgi:hypothetical protein